MNRFEQYQKRNEKRRIEREKKSNIPVKQNIKLLKSIYKKWMVCGFLWRNIIENIER